MAITSIETTPIADLIRQSRLRHVAAIMDGNRRWAKQKHLPTLMGHKQGVDALKNLVRYGGEVGLEALTVYAFSTENWQRSSEEVGYLMRLFLEALAAELEALHANNVRIRFIGDLSAFPAALLDLIHTAHAKTEHNTGLKFQIAANYGGRQEIVHAVRELGLEIQAGCLQPEAITPEMIQERLYTRDLPELDLLIRTGGEHRISNYLLWQCAYAELYVTETLWPDFSPAAFDTAVREFARRERRYGQ
ncbi:MAG TPA: polyprenyl diphosphate synthase [Coleofasciculaceae cyanobacterium]|jgi:undecaprenyl diphosphate synthase